MEYIKPRQEKFFEKIMDNDLDAMLVSGHSNVNYLSGFRGADAYLLMSASAKFLVTDFRFIQQAKIETSGFNIEQSNGSIFGFIAGLAKANNFKRIGFEAKSLPYEEYSQFYRALSPVEFIPTFDIIEDLRVVKDPLEIRVIKDSVKIARIALSRAKNKFKEGISEREFAIELDYQMRLHGAERPGFPTIVAAGVHAAIPHAISSTRTIKKSDMVIVDYGAKFNCYNSDVTRTLSLSQIKGKKEKIYCIVKEAHDRAISSIHPGIEIRAIDAIARDFIKSEGYGKQFGHALGHGVGLDVHEAPHLSSSEEGVVREDMVFTIEPAIYIEGFGGVRIEDMVVVTKNGCEVITNGID